MKKPNFQTSADRVASILRVDHAGEYGARCIYSAQLQYIRKTPDLKNADVEKIREMYEQEMEHYEYFNGELLKRNVRPTIMIPFWHFGSKFLGGITACLGIKYAMLCTKAVEEVIEQHYLQQVEQLYEIDGEMELKTRIVKFRDDELEHRDIASSYSEYQHFGYRILGFCIKKICYGAITVSKLL